MKNIELFKTFYKDFLHEDGPDEDRTCNVQRIGNQLVATDMKKLLLCDVNDAQVPELDVFIQEGATWPIEKQYNESVPVGILRLDDIRTALAKIPTEDEVKIDDKSVECKDCNGTGEVQWEYHSSETHEWYYHDHECPVCEGTGYVGDIIEVKTGRKVPVDKSVIHICAKDGDWYFQAKYFLLLQNILEYAQVTSVEIRMRNDFMLCCEVVEGLKFVVCIIRVDDERDYEHKTNIILKGGAE